MSAVSHQLFSKVVCILSHMSACMNECIFAAGRRSSKIVSILVSCFTANYVRHWPNFFTDQPLCSTPMFDGRSVL